MIGALNNFLVLGTRFKAIAVERSQPVYLTHVGIPFLLCLGLGFGSIPTAAALALPVAYVGMQDQEKDDDQDSESRSGKVKVRGQLVLANSDYEVELAGLVVTLEQIVIPPQLPLPEGFTEMELTARQEWYKSFMESAEGKKYQANLDKLDAERSIFTTKADAEGKFSFEDATADVFGLYGQKEFQQAGKTYLAEFFAEIPIQDKIRFIELDRLPVTIKRLLKVGETAPDLSLSVDAQGKPNVHLLKDYAGKPLLICFWSINSISNMQAELEKLIDSKEPEIQILGVNLNTPSDELTKFMQESPPKWKSVQSAGFDASPLTVDYAVSALPAIWLVSDKGKILATDMQFFQALGAEDADLAQVLKKAIAGEVIVPIEAQIGDVEAGK